MLFIDGYRIDVELRSDVNDQSTVTRFPVEKGADNTDHVQDEPVSLTVEGIVSDSPLKAMEAERRQFAIINGEAFSKPSDEARARLKKIKKDKEPITVECSRGTFKNMVLESLNETGDASTGDSYQFTATFTEIVLVDNQRSIVRVSVPKASKKRNLGYRAAVETVINAFGFLPPPGNLQTPPPPPAATSTATELGAPRIANRRPSILGGS